MNSPQSSKPILTRRRFLQLSGISSSALFLAGCNSEQIASKVGNIFDPLNQKTGQLLLQPQTPVPEFSISAIEPEALLINSFAGTPQINLNTFRLAIDGEVNNPIQLNIREVEKLPFTSMVIRHVCVEGWAAIVQWGGVRLRDLAALVQPKSNVRYVFFESADGYYDSWDLASVLHPQTLLAYQKNEKPLPAANGAPLRLASPVKLGYKQSKWITRVTFLSQLSARTGYWEDRGYEWFAGL